MTSYQDSQYTKQFKGYGSCPGDEGYLRLAIELISLSKRYFKQDIRFLLKYNNYTKSDVEFVRAHYRGTILEFLLPCSADRAMDIWQRCVAGNRPYLPDKDIYNGSPEHENVTIRGNRLPEIMSTKRMTCATLHEKSGIPLNEITRARCAYNGDCVPRATIVAVSKALNVSPFAIYGVNIEEGK